LELSGVHSHLLSFRIRCDLSKSTRNDLDPLNKLVEPENRFALVSTPLVIRFMHKNTYRSGVTSIFVADENVLPLYLGFAMHVSLKDIVSLKASQYHESGILNHLSKILQDMNSKLNQKRSDRKFSLCSI
jgi:hypothetical protein